MKIKSFIYKALTSLFIIVILIGCSGDSEQSISETPMDLGRFFFESILKGDFKSAKPLTIQDEANSTAIAHFERFYENVAPALKSETAIRSWKMEKWEELDGDNITMVASHEMIPSPITFQLKRLNGAWVVNFTHFP
jgi:hypothetical protein